MGEKKIGKKKGGGQVFHAINWNIWYLKVFKSANSTEMCQHDLII